MNRRQRWTKRGPRARDGHGDGIARVDLWDLPVRAEVARACASTELQRAGVQGIGEPGRSVGLYWSRNLMNREAVAAGPIPASGQTLIGPAATTERLLGHRTVSVP